MGNSTSVNNSTSYYNSPSPNSDMHDLPHNFWASPYSIIFALAFASVFVVCFFWTCRAIDSGVNNSDNNNNNGRTSDIENGGGGVVAVGHNVQVIIRKLPALPPPKIYDENKDSNYEEATTERTSEECVICLEEFKDGDKIQGLLECHHEFHQRCIRTWLYNGQYRCRCPVCRLPINN